MKQIPVDSYLQILMEVFEKFPIAAVISDKNDRNLYVNFKFTELTGYKLDEVATTEQWEKKAYPDEKYREYIKESIPEIVNHLNSLKNEANTQRIQHVRCKNGDIKSILFQDIPVSKDYFITLLEDLSEKLKSIQSLKEIEERYQRIVHFLPVSLVISNKKDDVIYVNRKFEETFGYKSEDIPNNEVWVSKAYPDPEYRKKLRRREREWKEKGIQPEPPRERKIVCKDGSLKWAILEEIDIGQGESITTLKDITAQKQAENLARDKSSEYEKIVEQASDMIVQVNPDRTITSVNPACTEILGYSREEMVGHDFREFVDTNYWDRMDKMGDLKINKEKAQTTYEIEMIKKNGNRFFVEINTRFIFKENKLLNAVAMIRDISLRKKMMEEQLHREKLESIGILAGGIAHDFNNILTSILGTINLLQINTKDPENQEYLADIEKATIRARDLTNQLLTFSKGGAPVKELTSIKDILLDTTKFVLRGSKIKYHFEIPEDLPPTNIDGGQISQVISNLVINAKQAMPKGGNIYVRADVVQISREDVIPLPPGDYIQIEIEDSGPGIPTELQKHIFEPYFSTKPTGSGLGLATSYSIIQNHDGLITFRSIENEGTVFIILLPITKGSVEADKKVEQSQATNQIKHILLYDDDKAIHTIMHRFCDHLGIKFESAFSSQEVKKKFQRQLNTKNPFDLVIVDLTVPGDLGGETVLKMVREMDPTIRVVVSSGYSTDPIIANYSHYGFDNFLKKPYTINQLRLVLSQLSTP